MRYAILSDIHSNLEAFTAVIDSLASERIDRYLCLGDIIGYGADPVACLERLQTCDAVTVAGNHEMACVGKLDLGWFHEAARIALAWTRDQLGFIELDYLRRLPLVTTHAPFTLVHASLRRPERFDYLLDVAQAIDALRACRTTICLSGHTHQPCVLEYDRAAHRLIRFITRAEELQDVPITTADETRCVLINPGSVGQPRDGDPRAGVALIDTERNRLWVRRVAYDIATAQRKIRQAGLPEFFAERLSLGR